MAENARIVSLGSILVDIAVDVPALPVRGGDVLATMARTRAGGGFNLAAAVARQGVECVYAAPHGIGPNGDMVRSSLAAEGVKTTTSPRADADTGFCITVVAPDGERTFITVPGVEAALSESDLDNLSLEPGDIVAISGYDLAYPQSGPILTEWLSHLGAGVLVAFDPGPLVREIPAERLESAMQSASVITMNEREAQLYTDQSTTKRRELLDAVCRKSRPRPEAIVIVRQGPEGCVTTGGTLGPQIVRVPAPTVVAVDTTGAGDAHTGVLLAELLTGKDTVGALTTANLAAAIAVTRAGPATAPKKAGLLMAS